MKVKELIQRLQKFNAELEVVIQNKFCDLNEVVVVDCITEKSVVAQKDYEFYYDIVPDECNSPEYPELRIYKMLQLS